MNSSGAMDISLMSTRLCAINRSFHAAPDPFLIAFSSTSHHHPSFPIILYTSGRDGLTKETAQ